MQRKFLAGGVLIALALAYMIYSGVTQSAVYFVTPSELLASPSAGQAYRLGGLVAPGSLAWEKRHETTRNDNE
jgi:cytochrome c-type biogenesis protein CcmE